VPALSGVSLLSFALNVPGPVAVARLVAEGATAVKIEPPGGDPLALYARAWYDDLHTGVTVVPLDLKTGDGRAALEPRLARADVVVTSQRPAALARLGLAPDALRAQHPHLRVVTIVGDTSAPDLPGHDVTYQAEAGLLRADLPATFLADLAGAADAVTAVLLALREPAGTHRIVGLRDALAPFAAPRRHGLTGPGGRFGGADPAYGVYAAADGLIAVAALEPHFRARFYAALGLPLDAPLHDVIGARTCDDWDTFARTHDVPLSRVR
jgi:alpha-methylacyl-CoA racemase